jgi:hypothetical protein
VEGRIADAELAADLFDRVAEFGLLQCEGDLLLGEFASFHS